MADEGMDIETIEGADIFANYTNYAIAKITFSILRVSVLLIVMF